MLLHVKVSGHCVVSKLQKSLPSHYKQEQETEGVGFSL